MLYALRSSEADLNYEHLRNTKVLQTRFGNLTPQSTAHRCVRRRGGPMPIREAFWEPNATILMVY